MGAYREEIQNISAMKRFGILLLAAVLGSAATIGLDRLLDRDRASVVRIEHSDQLPAVSSRYETVESAGPDFTQAAAQVMPSVVHIRSTQLRPRSTQQAVPEIFRDFFGDQFFDPRYQPGQPRPQVGSGSGVIVSADGYIITNNHVIDGADDIEVALNDKHTYKATLVGADPSTDLALLRIEADNLVPVVLGNSDEVRVGQWVLAIGNPFNLTSTVTAGIVSAKGRNINILRDRAAIESFIQTDAAVNPGNSGGALVDLQGRLIGINTAIASPTGSYSGYSFAVPVSIVRKVMEDLLQYGTVQRGYLGVMIRSLDGNLAREQGLDLTEGVLVDSLTATSAAGAAGVKVGDVIVAVDGQPVRQASELQAAVGTRRPGDKVLLTVNRKGSERQIEVLLRNQTGETALVDKDQTATVHELGAELHVVAKDRLKALDLNNGVQIARLLPGPLTRETDVRPGFIITAIDGKAVATVEDVRKALSNKKGGVMIEGRYEDLPKTYYYAFGM
ncbi:MAG: trypsin-like peptidase domain-containing protein [Bacteroidia bacterium]